MNKKKIIMIGIVLLTIVMISGVSFALWQINLTANSTNTITTGCFRVSMEEQNPISLENAFPITKEEGKSLTPYTFTITITCETYASYQINLEILNNTTFENLDYFDIMFEDNIFTLREKEIVSTTLSNAESARKLETGYLDANESKTFELRIWLDDNTPNEGSFMNKIFNSKITVIATHQTEFDRETPIATILAQKENGVVSIDASKSTDNNSIKNYYYSLDGENWILSKESTYEFQENLEIEYGVGTSAIQSLYNSTTHNVFLKVEDEYGNMSEVVSFYFLDELEYDDTQDNNLRYIGANPNNYVSFNNELWRIIGVMENIDDGTGKKESRIKLIRNESIGAYSWDSSESNIRKGQGINEWSQADVNVLLNDYYYNRRENQSCFCGLNNMTTQCSFGKIGIFEESKLYFGDAYWPVSIVPSTSGLLPNDWYNLENNSTIKWRGKIALMYASDYAYATSGGVEVDRENCLKSQPYMWDLKHLHDCSENSWLNPQANQWLLSPASYNGDTYTSAVTSRGGVVITGAFDPYSIRPALYLKSNVQIVSGLGTKENPFELSL